MSCGSKCTTGRGRGLAWWTPPPDAEAGRGLMLLARLATDWGYRETVTGKAVYFTLAAQADGREVADDARVR